jgi:hypothetical protein
MEEACEGAMIARRQNAAASATWSWFLQAAFWHLKGYELCPIRLK